MNVPILKDLINAHVWRAICLNLQELVDHKVIFPQFVSDLQVLGAGRYFLMAN